MLWFNCLLVFVLKKCSFFGWIVMWIDLLICGRVCGVMCIINGWLLLVMFMKILLFIGLMLLMVVLKFVLFLVVVGCRCFGCMFMVMVWLI